MFKENHIAFVIDSLNFGGVERVFGTIASGLLDRGYSVSFFVLMSGDETFGLPDGVKLHRYGLKKFKYFWQSLPVIFRLAIDLRKEPYKAIISGKILPNFFALLACMLCFRRELLILSEHSSPGLAISAYQPKSFLKEAIFSLIYRFYSLAHKIVAVSNGVRDELITKFGISSSTVFSIYNPVDIEDIQTKAKEQLNHPWFESKGIPVILAAGRLEPQKNFPLLLDAFVLVRQKKPCRLMILGEGKQRQDLEQKIEELGLQQDVLLHGFEKNPFAYMSKASLFVMSSDYEGLPTVLIEAMVCGCPIVSTDCPSGPAEILENGIYGTLVPVGDAQALAEAILTNLKSPNKDVRERAEFFSVERAVNQYLDLIKMH